MGWSQGNDMTTPDLDSAIAASHKALDAILKGDPSLYEALLSDSDDVTLGNPFGPYVRGKKQVEETVARAARNYRDGQAGEIEPVAKYISGDIACVVEVEHGGARVGGSQEIAPIALRVTSVFRREGGNW